MGEGSTLVEMRSCLGCDHARSKRFGPDDAAWYRVSCAKADRSIGDTTWATPAWCPFLPEPQTEGSPLPAAGPALTAAGGTGTSLPSLPLQGAGAVPSAEQYRAEIEKLRAEVEWLREAYARECAEADRRERGARRAVDVLREIAGIGRCVACVGPSPCRGSHKRREDWCWVCVAAEALEEIDSAGGQQ